MQTVHFLQVLAFHKVTENGVQSFYRPMDFPGQLFAP